MSKHVDADALLAALYEADAITPRGAKIIREFPAAEDRPIAEWRIKDGYYYTVPYVCSNCGEPCKETVMGKPGWLFCPNCGAKMKGGRD